MLYVLIAAVFGAPFETNGVRSYLADSVVSATPSAISDWYDGSLFVDTSSTARVCVVGSPPDMLKDDDWLNTSSPRHPGWSVRYYEPSGCVSFVFPVREGLQIFPVAQPNATLTWSWFSAVVCPSDVVELETECLGVSGFLPDAWGITRGVLIPANASDVFATTPAYLVVASVLDAEGADTLRADGMVRMAFVPFRDIQTVFVDCLTDPDFFRLIYTLDWTCGTVRDEAALDFFTSWIFSFPTASIDALDGFDSLAGDFAAMSQSILAGSASGSGSGSDEFWVPEPTGPTTGSNAAIEYILSQSSSAGQVVASEGGEWYQTMGATLGGWVFVLLGAVSADLNPSLNPDPYLQASVVSFTVPFPAVACLGAGLTLSFESFSAFLDDAVTLKTVLLVIRDLMTLGILVVLYFRTIVTLHWAVTGKVLFAAA
jgi:hypothetical protein